MLHTEKMLYLVGTPHKLSLRINAGTVLNSQERKTTDTKRQRWLDVPPGYVEPNGGVSVNCLMVFVYQETNKVAVVYNWADEGCFTATSYLCERDYP